MKVEIDDRPVQGGGFSGSPESKIFWGIRIRPETIQDVASLERGLKLGMVPAGFERIVNGDQVHYLVAFRQEPRRVHGD